jgi:hypothetical protein
MCQCWNRSAQFCFKKMLNNAPVQLSGVDRGPFFETVFPGVFH